MKTFKPAQTKFSFKDMFIGMGMSLAGVYIINLMVLELCR